MNVFVYKKTSTDFEKEEKINKIKLDMLTINKN
jgi:hypothetical protein